MIVTFDLATARGPGHRDAKQHVGPSSAAEINPRCGDSAPRLYGGLASHAGARAERRVDCGDV